jgi:translation initiation factor eIF-2B subunit alpha
VRARAQRGNYFAETSVRARATIAELGARFIRHGALVLTHGHSRVVLALLRRAVAQVGRRAAATSSY